DLGQVLADLDAGDLRLDFLERPAVGVPGLEVEGVELAGAAVHPQQDARPLALRVGGGVVGHGAEPAGERVAGDAGRRHLEPVTPAQRDIRSGHVMRPLERLWGPCESHLPLSHALRGNAFFRRSAAYGPPP